MGRNIYGKVYAFQHKQSRKIKVVKELQKDIILEKKAVDELLKSRKLLSQLQDCCFVVRLYAAVQDPNTLQLLLDYKEGGELAFHMKNHHFTEEEIKSILSHLILSLDDIHHVGVIYREVKPENILLDTEGFAYFTNFYKSFTFKDLSKPDFFDPPSHIYHPDPSAKNSSSFHLIDTNPTKEVYGTIPYIAPEVLIGGPHNEKVDWWGLGVLAYTLLYKEYPWNIPEKVLKEHSYHWLHDEILKSEIKFHQETSKSFKDLVKGLLTLDPEKRFSIKEIKSHSFFGNYNWELIREKKIPPHYRPVLDGAQFTKQNHTPLPKKQISVEDQKLFNGWDWINPRYPKGVTPQEEDIIYFQNTQDFPMGLQLYQSDLSGRRGKVVFSLKDIPEKTLFSTERGTTLEKISAYMLLVDNEEVILK
uniref:Protein kinase domain-containing protein n=1 Tax=Arcella intermedia TaxID=1963864 RepID=A0A6B2L542_9EUKA